MISITDVLRELIAGNPIWQFGLSKRLMNLSQLSKELQPQVEVRAKKEVKSSAILMALSRLQRTLKKVSPDSAKMHLKHLTIQTGVSVYTFPNTKETWSAVHKLFASLQKSGSYFILSEGMQEITFLLETVLEPRVSQYFTQKAKHHLSNLAALGMTFDEAYVSTPGVIYLVLQQLLLQGINIIEVSSTYSGLTLYVANQDAKFAFETLYRLL